MKKSRLPQIAMAAILACFVSTQVSVAANSKEYRRTTTTSNNNTSSKTTTTTSKSTSTSSKKTTTTKVVTPSAVTYSKTPVVQSIRSIPSTATVVKKSGISYYFYNGRYYRKESNSYIVVTAPKGVKVTTLPVGYVTLSLLSKTYYYFEGTYYTKKSNQYEVVEAPEDIVVYTLPAEADLVVIDGSEYYIYDGCIYSIVVTPEGKAFKMTGYLGS